VVGVQEQISVLMLHKPLVLVLVVVDLVVLGIVPVAAMTIPMTIPMGCVLVVALRQSAAPLIVIPVSVQIILVQLAVG
jgi:hypothetical protein